MSNLKKDIREEILDILRWPYNKRPVRLSQSEALRQQRATDILNLIESVIKESMVKELGKLEHNKRFFHKGIHVVAVSSIEERLAGLKGEYIKSKLINAPTKNKDNK